MSLKGFLIRTAGAATASLLALSGAVALAPAAAAEPLYCGSSEYVDHISVERWTSGEFKIKVTPKSAARWAPDPHAATVSEWHAVQNCVSGLYGGLADSIWDQLECHQYLAAVPAKPSNWSSDSFWATGGTYDLESWRGTFTSDYPTWYSSHCGNEYGSDPVGVSLGAYRPDTGQLDLQLPTDVA